MTETYPPLSDRIQSTFIDTLFIVGLMFVIAGILDKMDNPPDWLRIVLFVSIWLVYEPLATTLGATLGNYMKGIRVKQAENSTKRIGFLQALVRYIVKVALGWISFLTITGNPKRRAIHDMAVGSVMIKI